MSKNSLHIPSILSDLFYVRECIYDKCKFNYTNPILEAEGIKYKACRFEIKKKSVIYREAKITPTKIGLFVTLWKRNEKGLIEPFDLSDNIDLAVISVKNDDNFGQFVFPKHILFEKGILSGNNQEGKRGFRVYPPWVETINNQSKKTQQWQLEYFLEIEKGSIDITKVKKLYEIMK